MKPLSPCPRRGAALLAIIMFVAVLTLMLLSYLIAMQMDQLSTNSYSHSIRAEEIGKGGLQEIISDLYQEIDAGSQPDGVPAGASYTAGGKRIYIPKSNLAAQPLRNSYLPADYDVTVNKLPPTLVRVSRAAGRPSYSPFPAIYDPAKVPASFASEAYSTNASANGRILSVERWNKPLLLPDSASQAGLQITDLFKLNPPDWVYVTRSGRRVCTDAEAASGSLNSNSNLTNTNAVVGRYAYAIYDEGALLDINTAGFLSTATTPAPLTYNDASNGISQTVRGKSFTSYADLTQLPGLAGKQTVVDKIVAWRNKGGLAAAGGNFLKSVISYVPLGFLNFKPGDNPVLSRQDLIDYFKKLEADDGITASSATRYVTALQCLGTFSRSVNAPSWGPRENSADIPNYKGGAGTSPAAYKDDAEKASSANRNIANVRVSSNAGILHYKDDGNTESYPVENGDPLIQRRFSLAKLSWLTFKGPSAALPSGDPQYNAGGTAAAIQACFGLKWVSGSGADSAPFWEYAGSTGNTPQSAIKTLAQVAAESPPREPNFLELLKAGILSGSLGRDPGKVSPAADGSSTSSNPKTYEGPGGSSFEDFSSDKDRHIIQIAANIMDQADADNYPTAIHFVPPGFSDASAVAKINNTLFGNENLPYLDRVCPIDAEYPKGTLNLWLRPELWNPHQSAATPFAAGLSPTHFRTRAYGRIQMSWYITVGSGAALSDPGTKAALPVDYDSSGGSPNPAGTVYFTDTPGSASSLFFGKPTLLTKTHLDPSFSTPASNIYANGSSTFPNYPDDNQAVNYSSPTPPPVSRHFIGLFGGSVEAPPVDQPYVPRNPLTGNPQITPAQKQWMNPGTNPADPNDCHLHFIFAPTTLTVCLECWDPSTSTWRPYSFVSRSQMVRRNEHWNSPGPPIKFAPDYTGYTLLGGSGYSWLRTDPRTDRFSSMGCRANAGFGPVPDPKQSTENTMEPDAGTQFGTETFFPSRSRGFTYDMPPNVVWPSPNVPSLSGGYFAPTYWSGVPTSAWALNSPGAVPYPSTSKPDLAKFNSYYADPDGVVRPGDSLYRDRSTGDGSMLFHSNQLTGSLPARRPVILNRPFRSVAELGYAYRDLPFKTLDFFSSSSGDAALLDLFSVTDGPAIVSGMVNPSNAPYYVLRAILSGGGRQEAVATNVISSGDANTWAVKIARYLTPNTPAGQPANPLLNRAELATKVMNPVNGIISALPASPPVDKGNKPYLESSVRALSSVTDTRTWNLMIDIIAQSGRMAPAGKTLSEFTVEGERRYWLHIAIDRYTGKIIDQQLEPVYE